MISLVNAAKRVLKREEGASMLEYGLMLALVAIVVIAGATLVGSSTNSLFGTVASTL
jgi:pilus assembly protein Flp/PilA